MYQKKTGKEGSKSQKKIHEANISTLNFYRNIIAGSTITYFLITYGLFWDRFTTRYILLTSICFIANVFAYKFMSSMSTPRYEKDDRGNTQLIDAGLDLNLGPGGLAEHAKDLILACCLVQSLSLIHNGFWLLLLFIPGRIFYLFWVHILAPWIFDPNQSPQMMQKGQK
uniref:Transmembrane protein 208 n=1 Tax=Mesocestoides corti TaxID=53468 RepID=A0A5K3FAI2_MESCO